MAYQLDSAELKIGSSAYLRHLGGTGNVATLLWVKQIRANEGGLADFPRLVVRRKKERNVSNVCIVGKIKQEMAADGEEKRLNTYIQFRRRS